MNGALPPLLNPPAQETPALLPTLAGDFYTSDTVFAAEQDEIFEKIWFCAARSGDLANPGQSKKVQIGGESVRVVRGREGVLRAFLNVCRHRGAALCTEAEGQVKRNLQCSYHAWTYAPARHRGRAP